MNSSEIFTLALGLTEQWYITNVEILTDDDPYIRRGISAENII